MLVCAFTTHFARETAGAARTRHSLLPLFGGDVAANLGQTVPREGGSASATEGDGMPDDGLLLSACFPGNEFAGRLALDPAARQRRPRHRDHAVDDRLDVVEVALALGHFRQPLPFADGVV